MGGGSGIGLIDNLNPLHSDANQGPTIGNLTQGIASNTPEIVKGAAIVGTVVGAGYLAGSALGAGAATEAAAGSAGTGLGYLGTETALSGTGAAAAELGGAGASSAGAISYASGYLGADIGTASIASETGTSYLGANLGGAASAAPWYSSLIPSGSTTLGLANLYLNSQRAPSSVSAPASASKGYLGTSPSFQPGGGSTISIGGQANPQSPSSVQSILSSPIMLGLGAVGIAYLIAKKKAF